MNTKGRHVCEVLASSLDTYPGLELLGHVVGGSVFSCLRKLYTGFRSGCTGCLPNDLAQGSLPSTFWQHLSFSWQPSVCDTCSDISLALTCAPLRWMLSPFPCLFGHLGVVF